MVTTKSDNKTPKVAILNANPDPIEARIKERFPNLPLLVSDNYDAMADMVAQERPEVVLAFKAGTAGTFPRDVILGTDSVKWIQASGAGIDHWTPWDPTRVSLTNASGIHGDVMSEFVVWAILNHQLGMPVYAQQQKHHEWRKNLLVPATGLTLTIVGFGSIGEEVGRLAKALGMRVLGVRAHPKPSPAADRVVGLDALNGVLSEADYVLIVLPLTTATRGMINADILAAMKPGSYFINTGRGGLVDEGALIECLNSGHLAGAAIDVFATEPLPAESPFWSMPNVIVMPHASGDASDWNIRVTDLFCDNLTRWMAGEPLKNIVDPALGY